MPIVWLSAAVKDVIHLRTYIADESPKSAKAIGQQIDQAVSRLATMPHMGRPGRLYGTRELVISGTTYLVVYRVKDQRIEILRVLHGRQSFPEQAEQ